MTVYQTGQIVQMKKKHPCGSLQWEVLKPGMFFQIRCIGCGRHVEMRREDFEKGVRKIISGNSGD